MGTELCSAKSTLGVSQVLTCSILLNLIFQQHLKETQTPKKTGVNGWISTSEMCYCPCCSKWEDDINGKIPKITTARRTDLNPIKKVFDLAKIELGEDDVAQIQKK